MSWTNDTVLEFLELYKREENLWDPKHPLHRNRSEISEAWDRIQASLSIHCSVTDLKKKKESLMTSFRMHLGKKKSQEGYRTSWFAYPLMESFLGGKYECDSTNQLETTFFSNTDNFEAQSGLQDHTYNYNRNLSMNDKTATMGRQNKPVESPCLKSNPKKRMDESVIYLNNPIEGVKSELDECELYGQLLAKKLKKLSEHQRDLAMHEIDNVMFNAKMQNNNNAPQSRSYSASSLTGPRKLKSPMFIIARTESNAHFEDENVSYQEQS